MKHVSRNFNIYLSTIVIGSSWFICVIHKAVFSRTCKAIEREQNTGWSLFNEYNLREIPVVVSSLSGDLAWKLSPWVLAGEPPSVTSTTNKVANCVRRLLCYWFSSWDVCCRVKCLTQTWIVVGSDEQLATSSCPTVSWVTWTKVQWSHRHPAVGWVCKELY